MFWDLRSAAAEQPKPAEKGLGKRLAENRVCGTSLPLEHPRGCARGCFCRRLFVGSPRVWGPRGRSRRVPAAPGGAGRERCGTGGHGGSAAGPRGPKNRGGSGDGTGMGQGLGWDISENHPSGDQAEGSSQKFPPCSAEAVLPPSSGMLAQG